MPRAMDNPRVSSQNSPMRPQAIRVVAGVLLRGEQVLLAQRPLHKADGGRWELPGGKVEAGEGDRVALARELFEELGVEVVVGPPLGTVFLPARGLSMAAYLVPSWRGEPQALEAPALRWLQADALLELDCPLADRPLLPMIAAHLRRGP